MAIIRDLTYVEGRAHRRHKLDLHLPDRPAAQPMPLVLWLHGGSWSEGDKSEVPLLGLLQAGFAIASANYRYLQDAPFPAQIQDVKAALRFLRSIAPRHGLDCERVLAAGFSAGGHLAAMAGCSARCAELEDLEQGYAEYGSEVAAVAAFAAPVDVALTAPHIVPTPELAALVNPALHVSADAPPFYIQQGEEDDTVRPAHARMLSAALARCGVEHTLEMVPGLGHKMKLSEAVLRRLKDLLRG